MATNLKKAFFEQGVEIAYRCWGDNPGGRVIAKWDAQREALLHRYEMLNEGWIASPMSEAQARYIFPTDAVLA